MILPDPTSTDSTFKFTYLFYSRYTLRKKQVRPTRPVRYLKYLYSHLSDISAESVRFFTGSDLSHIVLRIDTPDGPVWCNYSGRTGTAWTCRPLRLKPTHTLVEYGELNTELLHYALPIGERSSWWQLLLWYYTGRPYDPISCVSMIHRVRALMGRETKGRTPDALYRELKSTPSVHQSGATGRVDL